MRTITLGELSFQYEEEHLDENTLPAIAQEDAKELLFHTQDVLAGFGLNCYLCFGTLLGAVRDKNFIKGDLDIDVYVKDEQKLFSHLEEMRQQGLILIRSARHVMYSFRYQNNPNCYIDIYILQETNSLWGLYCYEILKRMVPKKFMADGQIEFLGRTFSCPRTPERVLKFWYKSTWRTPIGKDQKHYTYDVMSHFLYKKMLGAINKLKKACEQCSNKKNK